jgi:hypothetical protein
MTLEVKTLPKILVPSTEHLREPNVKKWARNVQAEIDALILRVNTNLGLVETEVNAGGGGGGSVYELVKAKGNLSSANFANTEAALTWNTPAIGASSTNVSISGTEITIDTAGTYKFTVTLRTDSANRTELFIKTYIDTGSGKTQDTDEIVSDYVARDADQDTGAVTLITALELDEDDVVEFRGEGDCDGTCIGLDAGTILLVERVA